ncbi:cell division ATP-binding protein FtsE [archaeon]|nr:cell division ATP-binding protein FtsE [archaeon]|tara:strand:+ start:76 stop:756 length:681 start_codon:yes stop_codon:yes gene_type:complete
MIHFKGINKIYPPDTAAVKDLTLHIKPKEFVSIIGRSGAGKSTLVKLLTAEERSTNGKVVVGGVDITSIRQNQIPSLRRQIGVVYQDFRLLRNKTIFENIAFALQVCGVAPARIRDVVPQVLKIVGLPDKADRYPQQLSGGEQQRVAIARALIHRPKVLIADEPTGNLDEINAKEITDLLLKINEFGTTVILVSHDRHVVDGIKKRVVVMEDGKVVSDKRHAMYDL